MAGLKQGWGFYFWCSLTQEERVGVAFMRPEENGGLDKSSPYNVGVRFIEPAPKRA